MLRSVSAVDHVRLRLDRVRGAVGEIDPVFLDTPTLMCAPLGRALGCSVSLKIETLNPVRSFKGRGTEAATAAARKQGASHMVCASAGNLGQALAYSGSGRGLAVTVVAASTANPLKLRQIAALGADIRLEGEDIEDARLHSREIAEADGAYHVEDSLDLETDRTETIADGVAGRCPIPEVLDDLLVLLDDVVLVSEDSIKAGMRAVYAHAGLVVEPSAALGIAAVLEDPERFAGRRVTTILCGSNVASADFARWVLEPAQHGTHPGP